MSHSNDKIMDDEEREKREGEKKDVDNDFI
jgi:hypothetical protein